MQQSIWGVMHHDGLGPDYYFPSGDAGDLATDAINLGSNYSPMPGGYAGVLFFKDVPATRSTYVAQLILIVVDP
jgi:hypothetical protein